MKVSEKRPRSEKSYQNLTLFKKVTQNGHFSARSVIKSDGHLGGGGGGVQPQKPKPKLESLVVLGFLGFLEKKGVESTFLNIPDHLRPTCFLHFFRDILPGSDNIHSEF